MRNPIEYLADPVLDSALSLVSTWTLAALVASVIAYYGAARGLQLGPGIEVITLTSVATSDRRCVTQRASLLVGIGTAS